MLGTSRNHEPYVRKAKRLASLRRICKQSGANTKESLAAMRLPFALLVSILLVRGVARAQEPQPPDNNDDRPSAVQSVAPTPETPPEPVYNSPNGGGRIGADYAVGPEDILSISVLNVPELNQTVRVENDGTIEVRLLGRVKAAGLKTKELQAELAAEWGKKYLEDPEVTVFVREFHACPVSVIGAVEKPGLYEVPSKRTLIEVLSMAGGLDKRASGAAGRYVFVTRKGGFQDLPESAGLLPLPADHPSQVRIDLHQLLVSHDEALNIEVRPFDVVSVAKAGVVYVVGAVKKPGGFLLEDRDSVTVLQALAMAEGFSGSPNKKGARVVRRGEDGSAVPIPVDLRKLMQARKGNEKDKAEDLDLFANDILIVPDSTPKYLGKRGVEEAITVVTGIAIWRGF